MDPKPGRGTADVSWIIDSPESNNREEAIKMSGNAGRGASFEKESTRTCSKQLNPPRLFDKHYLMRPAISRTNQKHLQSISLHLPIQMHSSDNLEELPDGFFSTSAKWEASDPSSTNTFLLIVKTFYRPKALKVGCMCKNNISGFSGSVLLCFGAVLFHEHSWLA